MNPLRYRGRFAPSPTGPLHMGSLVAALGSFLDARHQGGAWLVRIEDIDTPRNVAGAAADILQTLAAHALIWDEEPRWQSQRLDAYADALDTLVRCGAAYPCACSRAAIAQVAQRPAVDGGLCYPGTCRHGLPPGMAPRAWRLRVSNRPIAFQDRIQGSIVQCLEEAVGDFVLKRADGLFAYQLAVTVDDAFQGISDIVRGADLLASTPRQMALQQALGLPTPRYAHLPLVVNAAGEKLSKQTLATPIRGEHAAANLCQALTFLGQSPPDELAHCPPSEVIEWACAHWQISRVPRPAGTLPDTARADA